MQKKVLQKLKRECVVCGKKLKIIVFSDKSYSGGYYYSKIKLTRKGKSIEYWECEKCDNDTEIRSLRCD